MDYFSETGNPCLGLGFSTGFTVISRRLCSGSLRSRWDTGREGVPSLPPNSTPTEGAAAPVTDHFPLPVIRKLSLHAGLGQRGTVTVLVAMSGSSSAKFSGNIGCLFFFLTSPVDPIGWGCLSGTKPWFNNRHTATALHAFHSEAPKHLANSAPVLFYLITIGASSYIAIDPDVVTSFTSSEIVPRSSYTSSARYRAVLQ